MIISGEISINHARTVMVLKFVEIILCLQIYLIYTQQFTFGISKKKKKMQKKQQKLLTFHLAGKGYF